jgi:Protein of unknown function (DUF998)
VSTDVSRWSPAWVLPLSRTLVAGFVVLNLVLIARRPDLSIREDGISSYLDGSSRWLAVLSFVALSAGGALLAGAVRASWEPSRTRLSALLFVYSAGVLLAGLTHPGSVAHLLGAVVAFAVIPGAVLVSSARFRIGWFVVIVASFATWQPVLHFGLGERLTVFLELAWLLWLGSRYARHP